MPQGSNGVAGRASTAQGCRVGTPEDGVVDAAWIGLIGTAIGTVLGSGLAWLGSRSQWAREQSVRWHSDRRAVYSEFLAAGDDYEELLYELAASRTPGADPWTVDRTRLDPAYRR